MKKTKSVRRFKKIALFLRKNKRIADSSQRKAGYSEVNPMRLNYYTIR